MADSWLEGVQIGSQSMHRTLEGKKQEEEFQEQMSERKSEREDTERHRSKQDELIDQEIQNMKEGKSRSGTSPKSASAKDPMEAVLSKSLGNARAAHSAALTAGASQTEIDAAARKFSEAQRNWDNFQSQKAKASGFNLYTEPTPTAPPAAPHERSLWSRFLGDSAPAEGSFHQYDK